MPEVGAKENVVLFPEVGKRDGSVPTIANTDLFSLD